MTRVVVHIDKLVLRGIDRADAAAVSAGIRAQLKSLLVEPGVVVTLATAGNRSRIKAGTAQVDQACGASSVGRNIGNQIAKGVAT